MEINVNSVNSKRSAKMHEPAHHGKSINLGYIGGNKVNDESVMTIVFWKLLSEGFFFQTEKWKVRTKVKQNELFTIWRWFYILVINRNTGLSSHQITCSYSLYEAHFFKQVQRVVVDSKGKRTKFSMCLADSTIHLRWSTW